MLTVHHLERGQSERIIWLCEELGIPYELKVYDRDPKTFVSPPELAKLHPTGSAPVLQDGDIFLGESGAITEYILTKFGNGKLAIPPSSPAYADYLYYLHFSNGYLQPIYQRYGLVKSAGISADVPMARFTLRNFTRAHELLDDRLKTNKWLAGEEFTAADIMNVWSLTTMRLFCPTPLTGYDNILRWLQDVGARPAYQRAMEKGNPGLTPVLGAKEPERVRPKV